MGEKVAVCESVTKTGPSSFAKYFSKKENCVTTVFFCFYGGDKMAKKTFFPCHKKYNRDKIYIANPTSGGLLYGDREQQKR